MNNTEKCTVSIVDFGAQPDGALQTERIQAAIDHCFLQGGGEVVIPSGAFLTGGLRLRSNVTLRLSKGAVLKGSTNPEDYMAHLHDALEPMEDAQAAERNIWSNARNRWNNALIRAIDANNIAIIGEEGSLLDGQNCFDPQGEEHFRGPHCINMHRCKNVALRGYTIQDSANWAHALFDVENMLVEDITVLAGHDGVHVRFCRNVLIRRCTFYTGDDCIAGYANTNVQIHDCSINTACNGMRFGGTNVLVENCRFFGPGKYVHRLTLNPDEKASGALETERQRHNMLSALTYFACAGREIPEQPGNMVIKNCRIEHVDWLFNYGFSPDYPWQSNRPLRDLHWQNVEATEILHSITAYGDAQIPLLLEMDNVRFSFREGADPECLLRVGHIDRLTLRDVRVENLPHAPLILSWDDTLCAETERIECGLPREQWIERASQPFTCSRF